MVSRRLVEGSGEIIAHVFDSQKESRPAFGVQQLCAMPNFVGLASTTTRQDDNTGAGKQIGPRHLPTPAKRLAQINLVALRTSRRAQVEGSVKFNVGIAQGCASIHSTPQS